MVETVDSREKILPGSDPRLKPLLLLILLGIIVSIGVHLVRGNGITNRPHDGQQWALMLEHLREGTISDLKAMPRNDDLAHEMLSRFLRPVYVLSGWVFSWVGNDREALYLASVAYYLAGVCLLYLIVFHLFSSVQAAFLAGLAYLSNFVTLNYGLSVLSDGGGYFMFFLSAYVALRYFQGKERIGLLPVLLNGLICGIGYLMKESVIVAAVFSGLLLILSKERWSRKAGFCLLMTGVFFLPVFLWQVLSYRLIGYTSLQFLSYHVHSNATYHKFTVTRFGIAMFSAINLLFIPAVFEWIAEKKSRLLSGLLLFSGLFLLLVSRTMIDRFAFYLFPAFVIPASSWAVREWPRRKTWTVLFLTLYILLNLALFAAYNNDACYRWAAHFFHLRINLDF